MIVKLLPIIIGVLCFVTCFVLFYRPKSEKKETKQTYKEQDFFEKRRKVLEKQGVLYHHPKLERPEAYYTMHVVVGVLLFALIFFFSPKLSILGFPIGSLLLNWSFRSRNKKDNEQMMGDVFLITSSLVTQVRGGIYVGEGFGECRHIVSNKRLKEALLIFARHMKISDKTFLESIDEFEGKFDNEDISALCVALRQCEDNGRVTGVIEDLSKQVSQNENLLGEKKQARAERTLSFAILIIFADIMVFILMNFLQSIMSSSFM